MRFILEVRFPPSITWRPVTKDVDDPMPALFTEDEARAWEAEQAGKGMVVRRVKASRETMDSALSEYVGPPLSAAHAAARRASIDAAMEEG